MGDDRLCWAERRVSWTREEACHAVDALATTAERVCQRHFPRSAGYETRLTHLRGLVAGARISVRRGSFHAVVSTHFFLDENPGADGWAIRLVSSARNRPPTLTPAHRRRRNLAIGLSIAAVVAVFVAACGASGLWGYFRLSLLMSFLIMMTPALAWLSAASSEANALAGGWPALGPASDDFERWRLALAEVRPDLVLLADPRALPFRR
ncbi:MAG: hypothetical protein H6710_22510 [Myxococcales bacterium]|nr:hypothetical protein [Myxococcales bacterium]MCB9706834.1 hypothetical protein [Myxococcales bacterium]